MLKHIFIIFKNFNIPTSPKPNHTSVSSKLVLISPILMDRRCLLTIHKYSQLATFAVLGLIVTTRVLGLRMLSICLCKYAALGKDYYCSGACKEK